MKTRPLHAPYRDILQHCLDHGSIARGDVMPADGILCAGNRLPEMLELGYLRCEQEMIVCTNGAHRPRNRYYATEAGLVVLASGVVPCGRKVSQQRFNVRSHDFEPKPTPTPSECKPHHWVIEGRQDGRCKKCGTTKLFPILYSGTSWAPSATFEAERIVAGSRGYTVVEV